MKHPHTHPQGAFASPSAGIVEKKSNDLLLIESFLRYKEVEGELDTVPLLNPFLGGSALLNKMDTIKVAPPSLSVDPFADLGEPSK